MTKAQFLSALSDCGVDVSGALGRFMGNEELFLRFLCRLPGAKELDALQRALEAQEQETFYERLHELKGVCANLGVTSMAVPAQAMLELYRADKWRDREQMEPLLEQLRCADAQLLTLIGAYQGEGGAL